MSDERDDKAAQRDLGPGDSTPPGDTRAYHPNILPKRKLPKHVAERCGAITDDFIFGRPWSVYRRPKKEDEGEEAVT